MTKNFFIGALVPNEVKLPGIHGLRAVAALAVLFEHIVGSIIYLPPSAPTEWQRALLDLAGTGVHLFFVLSAFSLANSTRLTRDGIAEYGIKRFFRIAPLYYAMVVFQQIWQGPQGIAQNILNFSFLFNLTPAAAPGIVYGGWTIGVEMLFYAALPIILLTCRSLRSVAVLAAGGFVVSWAAHEVILADPGSRISVLQNYAALSFATNIGAFCAGLLAFSLYREFAGNQRVAKVALILAAGMLAVLVSSPLLYGIYAPGRPAVLLLFLIYGLVCLSQATNPSWLMANAAMQHIGERSFSLYLVQIPVILTVMPAYTGIMAHLGGPSTLSYLACAVLTVSAVLIVSNLTYHLIEIPGVNIGRRVLERRRAFRSYRADTSVPHVQVSGAEP